jgi:hypothetical protein
MSSKKKKKTKNLAMRVKPQTDLFHPQPEGQDKRKNKKQNEIPTSSRGGAQHRRHLFNRHALVEEDDQI